MKSILKAIKKNTKTVRGQLAASATNFGYCAAHTGEMAVGTILVGSIVARRTAAAGAALMPKDNKEGNAMLDAGVEYIMSTLTTEKKDNTGS